MVLVEPLVQTPDLEESQGHCAALLVDLSLGPYLVSMAPDWDTVLQPGPSLRPPDMRVGARRLGSSLLPYLRSAADVLEALSALTECGPLLVLCCCSAMMVGSEATPSPGALVAFLG